MMIPTVHLNGDVKQELFDQNVNALKALRDAREAIQKSCPNGRNFYPQGGNAILLAMEEHGERIMAIARLIKEFEEIIEGIADQ